MLQAFFLTLFLVGVNVVLASGAFKSEAQTAAELRDSSASWLPERGYVHIENVGPSLYKIRTMVKWTDTPVMPSPHNLYEHEVVFYNWDLFECVIVNPLSKESVYDLMSITPDIFIAKIANEAGIPPEQAVTLVNDNHAEKDCYYPSVSVSENFGNNYYVDTRLFDKEVEGKAFTIGFTQPPVAGEEYYAEFYVVGSPLQSFSYIDVQGGLGHYAGTIEDSGAYSGFSKNQEVLFCAIFKYALGTGPACTFRSSGGGSPSNPALLSMKPYTKGEHFSHTWITDTSAPGSTPAPTPQPTNVPVNPNATNAAKFITDVTIPDGVNVAPNDSLNKVWRMKNTGTSTWTTSYKLVHESGSRMGNISFKNLPASVPSGHTVDVSINLTAPSANGPYRGYWRMADANGVKFGDSIWIDINVVSGIPSQGSTSGQTKLYSQANYGGSVLFGNGSGEYSGLAANSYSLSLPGGWSAITYRENSYGGSPRCWTTSEQNLQDHGWSNSIRSIKIYNYNACGGGQSVKLFRNPNYADLLFSVDPGKSDAPDRNVNSFQIPSGWSMRIFEEDGQRGSNRCWNSSVPGLGDHETWNIRIRSVEVFTSDVCPSNSSRVALCKETGANSGSNCTTIDSDIPNLGEWGFGNDQAKSIIVEGSWQAYLYQHENYNGSKYLYTSNNNDIRSYPGNSGNPYDTTGIKVRRTDPAYVTLYSMGDFNGTQFKTDRTIDDLNAWEFFDGNVRSIRVSGGYEAIVCEDPYFKGTCGRIDGDDPNINHIGKAVDIPGLGTYLQGKASSLVVCKDNCPATVAAPTPVSPIALSNFAPGTNMEFVWTGPGDQHRIQITGGALSSVIESGWMTGNTYTVNNMPGSSNVYRYRVSAWDQYGPSSWSSWVDFYIKDIAPTELIILGMNNVEINEDITLYGIAEPLDATNLSYSWSPSPLSGQGTAVAVFRLSIYSTQVITLTVSNDSGLISTSHTLIAAEPTPVPTLPPTSTPTATPSPAGVELLTSPWHLSGNAGSSEKYQEISPTALQGKDTLRVTYNLHGINAIGGDASAIIFDQNGWQFVGLANYGQNGYDGVQTVDIPLSDFTGLNPNANVGTLHTRFWYGSSFNVDITSIIAFNSLSSTPTAAPSPTPTGTPLPTNTPPPTATSTPVATVVPTATPSQTGVELLPSPWHLSGNAGSSEKYQEISPTALQGKDTLRVTYNLHGINAIGGDASAIIFDQNGWQFVGLANYGQNGYDGVQTVDIPLSDFTGLNPNANVGTLHTRFWYGSSFNVDVLSIVAFNSQSGAPSPTPTATPTPTPTAVPTPVPTATPAPTGTQLLSTAWHLSGSNGSSEKYQSIPANALNGKTTLRVTYNLHGMNALGADASAIIFDQNGWQFVSLANYGQNGLNGSQTVDIPLSHFTGLNPNANVGTLHTRFWYGSAFTVDITSIEVL